MAGWEFSTLMFTPDVAPQPKASWIGPDGVTASYDRCHGHAILTWLKDRGWQVYTLIELVGQAHGYRQYRMRRHLTHTDDQYNDAATSPQRTRQPGLPNERPMPD